jgi:hypothetical protein
MKRYQPLKLYELRSHPEQNKSLSAWDLVDKYKDDPDVFISFTELNKIGINPQSRYNTPLGIYTYPLKEFVERYIVKQKKPAIWRTFNLGYFAPFGGGNNYVNFIRLNGKGGKFIEDMYRDYGSNDYDRDMDKLRKLYWSRFQVSDADVKEVVNNFWVFFVEHNHNLDTSTMLELLRNSFYPIQIPVSTIEEFVKVELYNALKDEDKNTLEKLLKENFKKYSSINTIINDATKEAKEKNPVISMWNVTRELAKALIEDEKYANTMWNKILRSLGYSGFADRSGRGIIHPSEPMQAMFLSTQAFDVIERVDNKPDKAQDIIVGRLQVSSANFGEGEFWRFQDLIKKVGKGYYIPNLDQLSFLYVNKERIPQLNSIHAFWSSSENKKPDEDDLVISSKPYEGKYYFVLDSANGSIYTLPETAKIYCLFVKDVKK